MIFGGGSSGAIGTGIVFSLHDNFSATADKINAKWNTLEGTTQRATARMQKSMNNMKVGFAGMAVGAVMLAPILMGVGKSMEFNATMSDVYAKGNITAIETQKMLSSEALRLGEATKFSAKQAAEGQAFLAMAGFKSNEIMSAMPGVLNLAAAGNLDLARSADIASNILTGMGLKAKDMGRVADVLALGATSANVSVEMLGETFAYAASSAKGLGWSLEQVTAMSGMLGNIGIQGSSAGTAIQNFNRFLTKLDDKKLKRMNMTMSDIVDSAGNMKAAPDVFAKIMNSVKDMGSFQRTAILGDLFGPRGQKAIAAFSAAMESGFDFEDYIAKLDNAGGAAENISKKMLDNLKGDFTILGSVWETTLIKIGNAVEPFIRPIVQGFSKILQVIGKVANSPIGKWIIRLTAVVGSLAFVIGTVIVAINLSSLAAGKAVMAFASMGKTQIAATFASKGLARGLLHVGKAAITALIPLLPYLAIAAAIAAPIFLAVKAMKSFDEVMSGTAAPAKGFMGFMQKLGGLLRGIGHIWKSANSEGFTMTAQLHDALNKLGILDTVIAIGTWIVRVKAFFKGLGSGIKAAWNGVMKPIIAAIRTGLEWFSGLFEKLGFSMDKNTSSVDKWAEAGKIVGMVLMAILVPAFISLAISVLAATWPILLIIGAIAGVIWVIKNWGKVTEWFGKIWGKFTDWIGQKWDSLVSYFQGTSLKDIFIDIGQAILTYMLSPLILLLKLAEKIPGKVGGFATKALEGIGTLTGFDLAEEKEGGVSVGRDVTGKTGDEMSQLAYANAQGTAAQVVIPAPIVLQNNRTTEVVRDINIDMDGSEIRKQIDIGTNEDLERQ